MALIHSTAQNLNSDGMISSGAVGCCRLCDKMTVGYLLITEMNDRHDDVVLDTYIALLLGKNDIFNNFVQRGKDDWELGKDQTFDDVMENATVKYNNMVKQKLWSQTDSKDAKILALTALNNELKDVKKGSSTGNYGKTCAGAVTGGGAAGKEWTFTLDPWRIVKEDPTKTVIERLWYWSPHHKRDSKYYGMYVAHPPDKHDKWLERKKSWGKKRSTTATSTPASTTLTATQKLGLSSDLKAAMVANFQCTQEEADKLRLDAVQNNDLN